MAKCVSNSFENLEKSKNFASQDFAKVPVPPRLPGPFSFYRP